jgi:hypothetical protein
MTRVTPDRQDRDARAAGAPPRLHSGDDRALMIPVPNVSLIVANSMPRPRDSACCLGRILTRHPGAARSDRAQRHRVAGCATPCFDGRRWLRMFDLLCLGHSGFACSAGPETHAAAMCAARYCAVPLPHFSRQPKDAVGLRHSRSIWLPTPGGPLGRKIALLCAGFLVVAVVSRCEGAPARFWRWCTAAQPPVRGQAGSAGIGRALGCRR